MFLNNKTEGLSSESTMKNLLVKMGEELGVDVDHKIPVAMPGQRGTLETTTYFRAGETILNPGTPLTLSRITSCPIVQMSSGL